MQKEFYEIHRSDAVQILLGKDKLSSLHTNLKLAEQLEKYFPERTRLYLVKEDHLPLGKNSLTSKTF